MDSLIGSIPGNLPKNQVLLIAKQLQGAKRLVLYCTILGAINISYRETDLPCPSPGGFYFGLRLLRNCDKKKKKIYERKN